jgi:hypothetical protein
MNIRLKSQRSRRDENSEEKCRRQNHLSEVRIQIQNNLKYQSQREEIAQKEYKVLS